MHAVICMRTGQYNGVLQPQVWKTSCDCREAQRAPELAKATNIPIRKCHTLSCSQEPVEYLLRAPASTGETPLRLPGSQCRTQSPSPAGRCWERNTVCFWRISFYELSPLPDTQVRQQSTAYFHQTTASGWTASNGTFPCLGTQGQLWLGPGCPDVPFCSSRNLFVVLQLQK